MNSCYISRRAKSKTCMLQTRFVEISSPVFTYHANRTTPREQKAHQYLTHMCNLPVHACVLINDMTCVLATTKQYRTAIHTLDRVDIFGERYILAKIPKLHQSSLNICKHLAARCQQMQCIDTNTSTNTVNVNDTRLSTVYSTIKNGKESIQPLRM